MREIEREIRRQARKVGVPGETLQHRNNETRGANKIQALKGRGDSAMRAPRENDSARAAKASVDRTIRKGRATQVIENLNRSVWCKRRSIPVLTSTSTTSM